MGKKKKLKKCDWKPVSLSTEDLKTLKITEFIGKKQQRNKDAEKEIISYQDSFLDNSDWSIERKLADEIVTAVNNNGVPVKADNLTRGYGNCFPISVFQQLEVQERYGSNLTDDQQKLLKRFKSGQMRSSGLRSIVHQFVKDNSEHPAIKILQDIYTAAENGSWENYW